MRCRRQRPIEIELQVHRHPKRAKRPMAPSPSGGATILPAARLPLKYNHEGFVEAAARACLNRDCEPIEIIFSDDASTDATFEILSALAAQYDGPHKLTLRRSTTNLGISAHYNCLVALAMGDLLITASGDDISMPNGVQRLSDNHTQGGSCR